MSFYSLNLNLNIQQTSLFGGGFSPIMNNFNFSPIFSCFSGFGNFGLGMFSRFNSQNNLGLFGEINLDYTTPQTFTNTNFEFCNTPTNFFNMPEFKPTFTGFYSDNNFGDIFERKGKKDKPNTSGNYSTMSRSAALIAAKKDSNLEELSSGRGWKIGNSFENDIPYAKKGTGILLTKISEKVGESLTVTSALGTTTSPHEGKSTSSGHYNPKNPKLDFGGLGSKDAAETLATKLMNTGYFEFANAECHGSGWHIDAKIKDSAYSNLA